MSGATYRIETRQSADATWPRAADIYRVADDSLVKVLLGSSDETVIEQARAWVRYMESHMDSGTVLYVFDDGTDAPAPGPHSVNA